MLGARVDLELANLGAAQTVAREHSLDRLAQYLGRPSLELLAQRALAQAARVAGVAVVDLLVELVAGDRDLASVDDYDEVAGIDVRRELGLVLAAQRVGDAHGEATKVLALGVDDIPVVLDLMGFCAVGLHDTKNERTRRRPPGADCSKPRQGLNDLLTRRGLRYEIPGNRRSHLLNAS